MDNDTNEYFDEPVEDTFEEEFDNYDLIEDTEEESINIKPRKITGMLALTAEQFCKARKMKLTHIAGFVEYCRQKYGNMNSKYIVPDWDIIFQEYQNTPVK